MGHIALSSANWPTAPPCPAARRERHLLRRHTHRIRTLEIPAASSFRQPSTSRPFDQHIHLPTARGGRRTAILHTSPVLFPATQTLADLSLRKGFSHLRRHGHRSAPCPAGHHNAAAYRTKHKMSCEATATRSILFEIGNDGWLQISSDSLLQSTHF